VAQPKPDIIAARHLSVGARDLLRRAGIGWVDETGCAEIALGTVIVSRTGPERTAPTRKPTWTVSTEAVAEALLLGVQPTVSATSRATQLSVGACTKALQSLQEFELLDASAARGRASARRVPDQRALLDAFAEASRRRPRPLELEAGFTWRSVSEGIDRIAAQFEGDSIRWALTGAAAALHYAAHLTTVSTVEIYVDADNMAALEGVARSCALRPIVGGRLTLRPFPTATTRQSALAVHQLRIPPWPRVYVDLLSVGVRGEDAAEHLWEVVSSGNG